ncbi:conserved hypothetical protein [Bacillus sp. 349Y]|nr:conserved hypothetical protein [Bacillus sp. 349Y]
MHNISKMKIMFASHTGIGGTFVVGSHHLARELATLGNEVVHISTPITPFHLLKINKTENRKNLIRGLINPKVQVKKNLTDVKPFSILPWKLACKFHKKHQKNLMLFFLNPFLIKQFNDIDILIIDQPSYCGLEDMVKPKMLIYRATDIYKDMTSNDISEAENQLISKADALIGTSKPVLEHLVSISKDKPALLLENGVEFEHFSKSVDLPEEYGRVFGPIAVYGGALDERFDFEAITSLAKAIPQLNIFLIGPVNNTIKKMYAPLKNVYCIGAVKYEELPKYFSHATVGLLPLSNHPANTGRSPMKLYEYGAAGLFVVSKESRELKSRDNSFTKFYRTNEELINIIKELIDFKYKKENIKHEAEANSWRFKAGALLDFVSKIDNKKRFERDLSMEE